MQTELKIGRTGRWELHYSERLDNGKWRSRTVSTRETDRSAAESFQQVFEAQLTTAIVSAKGATVSQCIDAYLSKPKFKTHTAKSVFVQQLEQIRRGLGSLFVTDLNMTVLGNFVTRNKWADGTARRFYRHVGGVLRHSARMKIIKFDDIPYMELPPPVPPRDKWLDEEKEAEVYAYALWLSVRNPQTKGRLSRVTRFICLGLDTAQRKTAILKLKWSQVDLKAGIIDFRMKGATSKRQAVVPISDRLKPLLERAYRERVSEYVLDRPTELTGNYTEFVERIGYKWVSPHVLRHTAATLMLRAGVDIWQVAGILGNSPAMVERVYGHHAPEHLRGAINKRFS